MGWMKNSDSCFLIQEHLQLFRFRPSIFWFSCITDEYLSFNIVHNRTVYILQVECFNIVHNHTIYILHVEFFNVVHNHTVYILQVECFNIVHNHTVYILQVECFNIVHNRTVYILQVECFNMVSTLPYTYYKSSASCTNTFSSTDVCLIRYLCSFVLGETHLYVDFVYQFCSEYIIDQPTSNCVTSPYTLTMYHHVI